MNDFIDKHLYLGCMFIVDVDYFVGTMIDGSIYSPMVQSNKNKINNNYFSRLSYTNIISDIIDVKFY